MDPTTAGSNSAWWQYGAIGIIALMFALAIVRLYKRQEAKDAEIAKEREAFIKERADWVLERERIQTAQESELHRQADAYAQRLREDRGRQDTREDAIRQEFSELMERVAVEAAKASAELTRVLDKIYDRFLGPRPRY